MHAPPLNSFRFLYQRATMVVECLTLRLHLYGCRSLKEKRKRVGGLRERFGRKPNLAVSEVALHDNHHESEWRFVAIAGDRKITSSLLDEVHAWASERLDAAIVDSDRRDLPLETPHNWSGLC